MLFSSPLFLLLFFPAVVGLYFVVTPKARNLLLLVASLFFYMWGEGYYVLVLGLSILINWFFGKTIPHIEKQTHRVWLVGAGVGANVLMLVYYKYSNFLSENLLALLGPLAPAHTEWTNVHLPIGISFFVFQGISYLVDVYRSDVKPTASLVNFAMYKSFFPQLIAGPIVRYKDVSNSIETRTNTLEDISLGAQRFVLGLSKKVLIANNASTVADSIFALPVNELNFAVAWLGAIAYAIQLYFDFSGYSDMAIGMGRMFGFRFLENFNYPYIAKSIQDFWRRWHISLSTWFRDYVYIPLGGNRKGIVRQYLALVTVFVLCGFWHGANWTFVVWGLWNGAFLVLERVGLGAILKKIPTPLAHLYAMVVVVVGWVFFRSQSLDSAGGYLSAMLGFNQNWQIWNVGIFLQPYTFAFLLAGVILAAPLGPLLERLVTHDGHTGLVKTLVRGLLWLRIPGLALLLVLSVAGIALGTNNPFIYFRF